MEKIAITGNMGTGKSQVAKILLTAKESVLEADAVVKELYKKEDVRTMIQDWFGIEVFHNNGQVNRRKLGERVFAKQQDREFLERIFWPRVKIEMEMWFFRQEKTQAKRVFVVIPLLFEAGMEGIFDKIWLVRSSEEQSYLRVQLRDKISLAQAKKRLATQMSDKEKLDLVDVVIRNTGEINDLEKSVLSLLK